VANKGFSDESARVAELVLKFARNQSGTLFRADGVRAMLVIGADMKDDCAAYDIDGPATIVIGTDYVRGPHFKLYELGLLSNFDIGYYLVAANVSDVAAMGAMPIGMLTVVRYPDDLSDGDFMEIVSGIDSATNDFGTLNVGGDIGQAERIILSGTCIGICERGRILKRDGAQAGDFLCTTGACGVLGAAVAYFGRREECRWHVEAGIEETLLQSWKRPHARVEEGRLLARENLASACQDSSDGLKATIEQIAEASGVGFEVFEESIPIDSSVTAVAHVAEVNPLALALSSSADFQLVFTVPGEKLKPWQAAFTRSGHPLYVIGKATEQSGDVRLIRSDGSSWELPGVIWRHQRGDITKLLDGV
jgi:thiamine-monophosphate kinase